MTRPLQETDDIAAQDLRRRAGAIILQSQNVNVIAFGKRAAGDRCNTGKSKTKMLLEYQLTCPPAERE